MSDGSKVPSFKGTVVWLIKEGPIRHHIKTQTREVLFERVPTRRVEDWCDIS